MLYDTDEQSGETRVTGLLMNKVGGGISEERERDISKGGENIRREGLDIRRGREDIRREGLE